MVDTQIPTVTLNNGVTMPQFGLGVWQTREGDEIAVAMKAAFQAGYRLIDTAAVYGNETGVGRAIKASGLPRQDIFLTTKLWNADQGYKNTLKAFDASLTKLDTDYIDLYLIHWPMPNAGQFIDTWKAFEKLYADKRVRAVGVSNFKPVHLEELIANAQVLPAVNQIELHPKLQQHATREACAKHDIRVESYSPIMHGGDVLADAGIQRLADKYQKTPAQIVLRWHIQQGLIAIPKSANPARIRENVAIFDFALDNGDMQVINALDSADGRVGADPDTMHAS